MADYYVANNGDDDNAGTQAEPWKTVAKVNAGTFSAGDGVWFKRGQAWRELLTLPSSGSVGNPITFGAYGTGTLPVICGADLITGWSDAGSNRWTATVNTEPDMVLIDGTVGSEAATQANVDTAGEWHWSSNTLTIYATSDPDTVHMVEAGARTKCIVATSKDYVRLENLHLYGWNGYKAIDAYHPTGWQIVDLSIDQGYGVGICLKGADGCQIDGCTLTGVTEATWMDHGIHLEAVVAGEAAQDCTISHCTISHFPKDGISVWGKDAADRCARLTVRDNIVHDCGYGIYFHYTDDSLCAHNVVFDNTNTNTNGEGSGIGVQTGSNLVMENNIVFGNRNCGIALWGSSGGQSVGNIVRQNTVSDNGTSGADVTPGGISLDAQYVTNTQIHGNLVMGHTQTASGGAKGVFGSGLAADIYNNTLIDNRQAIYATHNSADDWSVNRNVVLGSTLHHVKTVAGISGFDCDHNFYYPLDSKFCWLGTDYTFANWQANSGQDASSSVIYTDRRVRIGT